MRDALPGRRWLVGCTVIALLNCTGNPGSEPSNSVASSNQQPASTTTEKESPDQLTALTRQWAQAVADSSSALLISLEQGDFRIVKQHYQELRYLLAKGAPVFRLCAPVASLALRGETGATERPSALTKLDTALTRTDRENTLPIARSVARAGQLLASEMSTATIRPNLLAQNISDYCYQLGLRLLGAVADLPDDPIVQIKELDGTLSGILELTTALAKDRDLEDSSLAQMRSVAAEISSQGRWAQDALTLRNRADRTMASARLGVAVRELLSSLGWRVKLPYPARLPTQSNTLIEPVSPFTVPASRVGSGDDNPQLVHIGQELFFWAGLSKDKKRSCASCHDPAHFFADNLARPRSLIPTVSLRNTPTLMYSPLAAAQLWDGRLASPASQALHVIENPAEMGVSKELLVERINENESIKHELQNAGLDTSSSSIGRALVAWESASLVPANASIDRFARGDLSAMNETEKQGLDIFVIEGRCSRCHIPPSFGGSRPPDFATPVFAVIGVPKSPTSIEIDPDLGRQKVTGRELDKHSFRTPTVRNISRSAPYFHNGSFATLSEVIAFYNKGGGLALGVVVSNQDPDVRPLHLSGEQTAWLEDFLSRSLTDPPQPLPQK